MRCDLCNRKINEGDDYSVINGKKICNKCTGNNKGVINIATDNSVINSEQNIYKKKGW